MAYTLNTSHALYGNLVELIGVQSGALVSHKTERTFTKHSEASYGSGTWGEHFRTVGGGFTAKGAAFTPTVAINTVTSPNLTLVVVVNKIAAAGGGGQRVMVGSTHASAFTLGVSSSAVVTALSSYNALVSTGTTDTDVAATPYMFALSRTGESGHKLYVSGAYEVDSASRLAFNATTTYWDYIGGVAGQSSVAEDVVWIAWFDKALSEAELDDLYASLGASNAFGLISSGTAHNVTIANSQQANTASTGSVSQAASTFVTGSNSTQANTASAGAVTQPAGGTIQLPPLGEWETDTLLPSETGITVWINDEESGALVLKLTGVTTAASTAAFDPISHASIVAGTAYSVRTRLADGVTQFTWTYVAT